MAKKPFASAIESDSASAVEFITSILQVSAEYSIIGKDLDGHVPKPINPQKFMSQIVAFASAEAQAQARAQSQPQEQPTPAARRER